MMCSLPNTLLLIIVQKNLGLNAPRSWLGTLGLSIGWVIVMFLYTPLADRISTHLFQKPPTLNAFRALQQSRVKLVLGIVIAWILGGFLEELLLRGIVLRSSSVFLATHTMQFAAEMVSILVAAASAFILHLYQGLRAAFIVTQLSVLFGILFVVSGFNLWAVILCHEIYDTVAFIRFANKSSKYSTLDLTN